MTHNVTAVRYATRETTKSDVYYRYQAYGEADGPLRMDYFFWLLERAGEITLVDTGFAQADGERRGRQCLVDPGEALARLGVDPSAVRRVILTHLHYDHTGNIGLFPEAELVVAARELEFWTDPVAARSQFADHVTPRDIDAIRGAEREGRVRLVHAEEEIAPGLVATPVGGHSAALLVLSVDAGEAGVVLASDSMHYYEELELDRPFGVLVDLAESYRAFDTLRRLTKDGQTLVAGHDPVVLERFTPLSGGMSGLGALIA